MKRIANRTKSAHSILSSLAGSALVCLFLLSPIFSIHVSAKSDSIHFENISTEQGLSQSTVHAILQDHQGFMWFATEGGLDKYDGYQFTAYQHDPSDPNTLSNNVIASLYQDRQGNLFVGTSVSLDEFDPETTSVTHIFQNPDLPADLAEHSAQAIFQDNSGKLWIGTEGGGLAVHDPSTNKYKLYQHSPSDPQTLADNNVNVIFEDSSGELWIGTDAGLDRFQFGSDKFELAFSDLQSIKTFIGHTVVLALAETADGSLWIGTDHGLFRWVRSSNQLLQYLHGSDSGAKISDNMVTCLLNDSSGMLWIGTRAGLTLYDPAKNIFSSFLHDPDDPTSLASDSIRSIFEDRSGVLWIGTSAGLSKYARSTQKFSLLTRVPGSSESLSDNNVWAVLKDRTGGLWVGTFSAGLNYQDPNTGSITVYKNDPQEPGSIASNEIRTLLEDHTGALWIGTERGGLDRFDPNTNSFTHYLHDPNKADSLSGNNVFTLYEDNKSTLWIGTSDGGLNRMDQSTGTFIHYEYDSGNPNSLSDNNVRAIHMASSSSSMMWVGTFGGLNLFYNQGVIFLKYLHQSTESSSLSSDMVASIYEDNNGVIWIGTFGGGLDRLETNRTFTHFTVSDGLADNTVYCILGDTDGNLWLSTNKGLSKFNPKNKSFRNYDYSDGLQGNQFNPGACTKTPDGELFFGGTNGLNAFYPAQVQDNPLPPPVVITAFQKFNQTIKTDLSANETIQLSYQDNFISFEFAALDYNAPSKNEYAYQLIGVDKDWVNSGTRRYASYTNLPGGNYTFRVKASNNDGVWNSTGTAIHIHITPPFWHTWWFIGIVCLVAGTGAVGGYRLRIRGIESRNRELARRVEQRTHDLATLNKISGVVNQSLDICEILNNTLDSMVEVMHMDGGLAFSLEDPSNGRKEGQYLKLLAYRGVSDEIARLAMHLPLESSVVQEATKTGKPYIYSTHDHPDARLREANQKGELRIGISLPLVVKGNLIGTINLVANKERAFTQEEMALLEAMGQQVGMALVNARLYGQAEESAIAAERSRLARELHDSVTQLLYSVTLYAEAAAELLASGEKETAADHLHELRDTAQEALREMRLLIFELHRPALEQGGLAGALMARLEAVEKRGGMQAELQVEGSEHLPRPVQSELYNIAHEALNNALKHAHAGSVRVCLHFEPRFVQMDILDDGKGFEADDQGLGGGFGIPGMHERAHKIAGTLKIESAPGKGTRVSVTVPLDPKVHQSQASS